MNILAGELPESLEFTTPNDRLGAVLRQLSDFQDRFQEMTRQCSQLHRLSDEFSSLSARINAFITEITQSTSAISMNSEQIQMSAQKMGIASREMASTTQDISMNTPELEQVAGNAVERVTSANKVIDDLKEHSAEIGDIIQLITDISQQTNLLALNATIEAARAGEAGKGSAVVANEIKNLSRETAESTENIIQKLETIQASSEKVREVIDDVSIAVIEIHHATGLISDSLNEQTMITNDIAQSLNEAMGGSQQISQAITVLTATFQKTHDAVNQMQDLATRLASLDDGLQHGIAQLNHY
jgi:methyl-accepting chemotaxis protein